MKENCPIFRDGAINLSSSMCGETAGNLGKFDKCFRKYRVFFLPPSHYFLTLGFGNLVLFFGKNKLWKQCLQLFIPQAPSKLAFNLSLSPSTAGWE